MENRCKFLVIPLRAIRFSNIRSVLRGAMILLLLLFTSLIGTGNYTAAQQGIVTGTVIDNLGQPIVGVTVLVKGTTKCPGKCTYTNQVSNSRGSTCRKGFRYNGTSY